MLIIKTVLAIAGLIAVAIIGSSVASLMNKESLEISMGMVVAIIIMLVAAMSLWRSVKSNLRAAAAFREQMDSIADQRQQNIRQQRSDQFESPYPERGELLTSLFKKNKIGCRLIEEKTCGEKESLYKFKMGLGVSPHKIIRLLNSTDDQDLKNSLITYRNDGTYFHIRERQNAKDDWTNQTDGIF